MSMDEPHRHPDPSPAPPSPPTPGDAAGEHLAGALRTSFRLLGAIMVLGLVAFLAMGFSFVQPGEVAVRTVFGEVVGTTREGLAYNWPAPIGRIERIHVGERSVTLEDFWMHETKKDQLQPELRKRQPSPGGLRPGLDGALLTGDRHLLHMRLRCTYVVNRSGYLLPLDDPLVADRPLAAFVRRAPAGETVGQARGRWRREEPDAPLPPQLAAAAEAALRDAVADVRLACALPPALLFRMNVRDANETMRSALCAGAIAAAAHRTADGLQRTQRVDFERDVRLRAQRRLDELETGILVRTVKVVDSTWPLRTLADYDAAQQAVSQAEEAKNVARGEAVRILNSAVGPAAAKRLVGDPRRVADPDAVAGEGGTNLIGAYNLAVATGDAVGEKRLLEEIEAVLLSDETEGQARRVLREARTYRTARIQSVKRRVSDFLALLPAYRKNPGFVLSRWWMEAREAILDYPTAEKHYVPPGEGKTVLYLGRDPDTVKAVDEALLKESSDGARGGQAE